MAYTLITANRNYSSWSLRPWVLMTALGISFEDRIELFANTVNFDAFRKFSPSGMVPCLIDTDRVVWDSLGIALYLADRHDGIWPDTPDARAWAMCAVTEMHGGFSALRNDCTMNVGVRVKPRPKSAALEQDIARITEIWTEGLSRFGGPWLSGKAFTAADAFYAPVVWRVRTYGLDVGALAQGWVDRMIAHPAMQQWEMAALAEPWREVAHEAELTATGELIADYRA